MKNLTVYYSWTGNTEAVAGQIQQLAGGDLLKLEEEKPREISKKAFVSAAFSALFGRKSRLKPLNVSLEEYDAIFLGTPVWAGRPAPAVNAFLKNADLSNKKVVLFLTLQDDKPPSSAIAMLTEKVARRGGKVADSFFVKTNANSVIGPEAAGKAVLDWFKSHSV